MRKFTLRPLRAGLMLQLLIFIFLPLAALLLVVAFGSSLADQGEMRSMLGERDELAVRAAASALGSEVSHRQAVMDSLAQRAALSTDPSSVLSSGLLDDFDVGVALFSVDGNRISSIGAESLAASFAPIYKQLSSLPVKRTILSTFSTQNGMIVEIGAISPNKRLVAVGSISLGKLFENNIIQALPASKAINILLLDGNRKVLFEKRALTPDFEGNPGDHPGVMEALAGQSGTIYMQSGNNEHVMVYSPVIPPGWALVMEEPWETAILGPLIIAPLLLLAMLALWFGARQVIQPLQQLESKAARLALGNFEAIKEPVKGIAEIRDLQDELIEMAGKVQSAQQGLHDYIGTITAAQEDERRRIARELHDDIMQTMIALKQRLQLAQIKVKDETLNASLREVQDLTEEAIQNLRRTMRALRPIYLDDLGLVPALEMLARETKQPGLEVRYTCKGTSRRLDTTIELVLYRVAQEALSNIVKHARAKQASVTITFDENTIALDVRDDGVGFDASQTPGAFASQGHFGLLGLRERADLLGATLEISSSTTGGGTRLRLVVSG